MAVVRHFVFLKFKFPNGPGRLRVPSLHRHAIVHGAQSNARTEERTHRKHEASGPVVLFIGWTQYTQ